METAEMRRSTLQRKDRDELTQIATTLGKKPSSRARKGEIIDLILDLAAGGDGGGNAEEPDSPDTDVTDATASPDTGDASDDDTDSDDDQPANDSSDASVDADNRPEPGNRRRRRRCLLYTSDAADD